MGVVANWYRAPAVGTTRFGNVREECHLVYCISDYSKSDADPGMTRAAEMNMLELEEYMFHAT